MRRFFFPLFWKFTIAIILIVAVFGSINILLIWSEVYTSLEEESQKRGHYISQNLAHESVNALLYEDYIALQQMVENITEIDTTVAYAMIISKDREVLVHTFRDGLPAGLLDANDVAPGQTEHIRLITPRNSPDVIVRDIAVPVLDGKLGTVRIGILEESLGNDVQRTINVLMMMVVVFLAIGIVGALVMARFINRPVAEISRVADRLDLDALRQRSQPRIKIREKILGRWKIWWRAEDELDLLAEKFNGMISRLEEAYAELQTAHSTVIQSEKLASVGTLSAGIAHEINNPIAGLQSCIRRIAKHPENLEQNKKYLQMMEEAANKIARVVKGLLEYTRKEKMEFEEIDCEDVVEKALMLAAYQLEKARIIVTREFPADLPRLFGSPNHLQQVFVNMFLNSIDAINDQCRENENCPRRITISAHTRGEYVKIAISDTGTGISPVAREKMFDPFFTTKRVGQGTGLGLAVSDKIVRSHRGMIVVDSQAGEGTTISVLLPYMKNKEATSHDVA